MSVFFASIVISSALIVWVESRIILAKNAKKYLREHPEIAAEIEAQVRAQAVVSNRISFGVEDDSEEV